MTITPVETTDGEKIYEAKASLEYGNYLYLTDTNRERLIERVTELVRMYYGGELPLGYSIIVDDQRVTLTRH